MKNRRLRISLCYSVLLALLLNYALSPPWADIIVYEYNPAGRTIGICTYGVFVIEGDIDHDGDVDRDDMAAIRNHWNHSASECPECDLNGDGIITAMDARKLVIISASKEYLCP